MHCFIDTPLPTNALLYFNDGMSKSPKIRGQTRQGFCFSFGQPKNNPGREIDKQFPANIHSTKSITFVTTAAPINASNIKNRCFSLRVPGEA